MVTRLAWILNIQHWNPADLPAEARRWTQSRACLPSSSMCYPRLTQFEIAYKRTISRKSDARSRRVPPSRRRCSSYHVVNDERRLMHSMSAAISSTSGTAMMRLW
ncbi:hypothetical protein D0859_00284 [Hortaea werneckii]|uniref:Uncharacterized protein n=1 Tax=Hortaea werneckii TaxID=91943 RepID=A0A3M7JCY5_HORWE|nr:hypothetical protein D0859_00284 [Hortaea werneckii]